MNQSVFDLLIAHISRFAFDSYLRVCVHLALPEGQEVVSAERYGNSAWASTASITVRDSDGTLHDYFVKVVKGKLAGPRVLGEFSCMSALYKTMPSIVPAPRGSGKCLDSDDYFFLCDYLDIDHRQPDPMRLAESISELHRISVSPTGQFGFHVTPYDGKLPLVAKWDSNWVSFYGKLLEGVYKLDIQINGHRKRLDDAMKITLDKVVPRLLNRLYEEGRTVKPCLIHGDLWEEKIGTNPPMGNIYIFDSCAYYAHHEPVKEYDDRNRLYSLKEKIMYSAHVPGTKAREQALEDMLYLIRKFVNQAWPSDRDDYVNMRDES
ncbi:hypothetical protein PMG11_04353 [Penicillium brasilianum]|uniref:protein-ribulosamine 3-kinase n=1 Tax=Penicillium brasilianum TaxID=104259 RepID=A0A0F7VFX3_PENBI|nr:hypothetical protein PMG11_04353 [Penicillium brasilianum]